MPSFSVETKWQRVFATVGATKIVDQLVDPIVEASCDECPFGMEGNTCDLAVRMPAIRIMSTAVPSTITVTRMTTTPRHNCVREARVSSEIKGGRFVATNFNVFTEGRLVSLGLVATVLRRFGVSDEWHLVIAQVICIE